MITCHRHLFVLPARSGSRRDRTVAGRDAKGTLRMHDIASRRTSFWRDSALVAVLMAGLPLAACQTGPTGEMATIEAAQGSEQNIASLTAVIDAQPARSRSLQRARLGLWPCRRATARRCRISTRRSQLNPNFYQAYSNRALIYRYLRRPGQGAGRLQPRHPDQRELRRRLYRARRPLPEGRPHQGGLQRFPEGDPARHHRRPRLPPPRPDLPGAGPAHLRDRGFLDRDLAVAGFARALQWPRRLLPRTERRRQRIRRLQHGDQAQRKYRRELGQPGG